HQPLHVGKGDDRGGNSFQVQWFKKGTNLHHVWDESLVDGTKLSYTELAHSLDHASKEQIHAWSQGTIADWAQENVGYRARIYPKERGLNLSYEYRYEQWPLMEQQLLKAGIRLAGLLNSIYG
ncbi:MAG TPA: S1/P1 nuclease, partial [Flavobacteriales bacterium]|nr:S1/P1 nuclease [Flavobacteriales bacterium]